MTPIHIVGAGGIGCAVGYALCKAGLPVTFVDTDTAKIRWGQEHGVRLDTCQALQATFQPFAEWMPDPQSVVLLCTKCYDNATVLDRLKRTKGDATPALIPIQNGFDRLLESHGSDPEGIASFVSECYPQRTHTRITRKGRLHLGYRGSNGVGRTDGRFAIVADALNRHGCFRVTLVPDILPYKYTKLMYNAAISPLAAAAGLDNGQLLSVPKARRLFFALLRENYEVLRHAGIRLGKIGPFHPNTVSRILARSAVANALAWAFYPSLRGTYCSMADDLPAGRTEIDNYNLHLMELAGPFPCPLNQRVYALVKRMERDRLPTGTHRLDELLESPESRVESPESRVESR